MREKLLNAFEGDINPIKIKNATLMPRSLSISTTTPIILSLSPKW